MVKPYDVSEPWLFGDVDPDVMAFATEKFVTLARGTISRLQRWDASGIFEGEAHGLQSLWDEWCWYQAHHGNDTPLLSDAMDHALYGVIQAVLSDLKRSEAVLLTKAAAEETIDAPTYDPELLHQIIRGIVTNAASQRILSRFEVY